MKNKRLKFVLGVLVGLVIVEIYRMFLMSPTPQPVEDRMARVGVLQFVTHESLDEIYRGIQAGLAEAGYTEGQNLTIDFLNAEADQSQVQKMSQTLVNHQNQVLVGIATPAAQGLANVTQDIPVVMGAVTDPLGANLVKDLQQPGGNVTGVSDATPVADTVTLIQKLTPKAKIIGILYASSEDNSIAQVEAFTKAAEADGYQVLPYAVPSTNEIAVTVDAMLPNIDVLWVPTDNTIASAFPTVIGATKQAKKPVYTSVKTMVAQGGLASVSLSQYDLGVATGKMVAKLLAGANPATTPVEVYATGTLVINQKVADELGLNIPDDLLAQAELIRE